MKIKMKYELFAASLLLGSMGTAHANIDSLLESCNACHGSQGVSTHADIPTIAGIAEINLGDQLRSYLDGRPAKVVDGKNMTDIVKKLSEEQIDELAAHYAGLSYTPMKQPFDAALAQTGKKLHESAGCEKCHTEGGSLVDDEASILAGQPKGYMLSTLQEVKAGKRTVDEKMDKAISTMGEADLKALSEFYASKQ
ncbi:c-type cytochrome [Aeromonas aquatica]|uniref:periplasmic diheme shuttle PdsA n=3 Tax=Aeromonas TaxID=642 RepID=UPI00051BCB5C